MTAIRLLPGSPSASPHRTAAESWRLALAAIEFWDDAVCRAHLAVIDSAPGKMLAAVERWRATEERLAAAHLRERRYRMQAGGRRWLEIASRQSAQSGARK